MPGPLTSGAQGLVQVILERRRQQELDQIRRQQMEQDRQLREREIAVREQDAQARRRAQTVQEAMSVLALGDKDAAGALLQSQGIDLRREAPVTSDQMGPGLPSFAHLRTPEEREIAKEERGFGREKELVGVKGAEEERLLESRKRAEIETRQATDPQAALTGFITRAKGGQLSEDDQAVLDALLVVARKDEGARASLERRIVGKLTRGETLEPFEQDFARTHLQGRKPADVEALERGFKERSEERAEESLRLQRGAAGRAEEGLSLQRGAAGRAERESGERSEIRQRQLLTQPLEDLDNGIARIRKTFEMRVRNLPLGKDRQAALAANEAEQDQTIRNLIDRYKKRFPKLASEIEEQFGVQQRKPPLLDLFRKAFQ